MSICPKNKSSKGRRDKRRANWKMSAPTLVKCSKCGALMMPHRVCKACGSYNKKEIISVCTKLGGTKNTDLMTVLKTYVASGNPNAIVSLEEAKNCLNQIKAIKSIEV